MIQRRFEMIKPKGIRGFAMILIATVALSGCALFDKCNSVGCADDAKIAANVQARLNQDADLGPSNVIMVQTLNHVVYLNGLVDVGLERRTAEAEAKQVPGVTSVVNNVAVQHWKRHKPGRAITECGGV
jgi:osmotically-inducible protein OsmY